MEEIDMNDISAEMPESIEGEDIDWESETKKYLRIAKSRGKKIGQIEKDFEDYKKSNPIQPKEVPKEQDKKQSDSELLKTITERFDKQALKIAGIVDNDEVELAMRFRERTGLGMDEILSDEIFQAKLEKIKTDKSNSKATANIKGSGTGTNPKANWEFWKGKKDMPTPENIPNKTERVKVIREIMKNSKNRGRKFYNDPQ